MTKIKYIVGDVTNPEPDYIHPVRLLTHCANNKGYWGAGVVLAISKKWEEPEHYYRAWSKGHYIIPTQLGDYAGGKFVEKFIIFPPQECKPFELGQSQFVPVESDLIVLTYTYD